MADYSKQIFEKYFNSRKRLLKITLKDHSVLVGLIVGFFHGDTERNEPFVNQWHFIDQKELDEFNTFGSMEEYREFGRIIHQDDIETVTFN